MSIRYLFSSLFAVMLLAFAMRGVADPDMWWHLRTGQWIIEEGFPKTDPFSLTKFGEPWVAHEWLADVFMWGVYRLGGLKGLSLAFAGLITGTFWLVSRTNVGKPYLATLIALLAALTASVTWGTRPQMFNILFLALFLYFIERYRAGSLTIRGLLWLIPLTTLWANFHSGYLVGVVVLGVYTVGEAGQMVIRKLWPLTPFTEGLTEWRPIGQLGLVTVGSLLAAALNPNGVHIWIYPFETLGSPAMQRYINEWQSPNFHLWDFRIFAIMIGVGVLAWTWSSHKPHLAEMLLFAGGAAAGLISARNIPLFAVAAAPIISRHLLSAFTGHPLYRILAGTAPDPSLSRLLRWLNGFILLTALLIAAVWVGRQLNKLQPDIENQFPIAAVDYLQETGLADKVIFNDYTYGGYLIWRGIPVFVDGRADLYGDEFLFYYLKTYLAGPEWQEPLDEWDVEVVLMRRGTTLTTVLTTSSAWDKVYEDDLIQIFTRN